MVRRYSLPALRPDHLPVLHVGHQAERLSRGRAFRGAALFCSPAQGTCPAGSSKRKRGRERDPSRAQARMLSCPRCRYPRRHACPPSSAVSAGSPPLSAGLCSAALKTKSDEKRDYRGHSLIIKTMTRLWQVHPAAAACSLRFLTAGAASSPLLLFRRRASILLPTGILQRNPVRTTNT